MIFEIKQVLIKHTADWLLKLLQHTFLQKSSLRDLDLGFVECCVPRTFIPFVKVCTVHTCMQHLTSEQTVLNFQKRSTSAARYTDGITSQLSQGSTARVVHWSRGFYKEHQSAIIEGYFDRRCSISVLKMVGDPDIYQLYEMRYQCGRIFSYLISPFATNTISTACLSQQTGDRGSSWIMFLHTLPDTHRSERTSTPFTCW